MQKIAKLPAMPSTMAAWLKKNKQAKWSELPFSEKQALRHQLLQEQNGICCYCCKTLSEGQYHIEHLKSRDNYAQLTFVYDNLLASCNGNAKHCGHKKGNTELPVTPLMDECDEIQLNLAGELQTKHTLAKQSIDILNLNDRQLCQNRKNKVDMIKFAFDPSQSHTPIAIMDKDTLDLILQNMEQTPEYYELKYIIDKLT